MSFFHAGIGSYWRPHEYEALKRYFGEEVKDLSADYFFWRHNTEAVNEVGVDRSKSLEQQYLLNGGKNIVNPMDSFKYTNSKEHCFEIWQKNKITIPKTFTFESREDFEKKNFLQYPFLIRLNDGTNGRYTYLIEDKSSLEENFSKLLADYSQKRSHSTKMLAVEFIDTTIEEGYKISYRVHVAGNRVVSGYARVSETWWAFTPAFKNKMKKVFVEQQNRVHRLILENQDEIVKSVQCLGLHHVGVDIIPSTNNRLYFLEVQPFYFCGRPPGHPNPTNPPFYNPTKPKELLDWLINNKELKKELPYYYENWLDKENHFDLCYSSLWDYFND